MRGDHASIFVVGDHWAGDLDGQANVNALWGPGSQTSFSTSILVNGMVFLIGQTIYVDVTISASLSNTYLAK